MPIEGYFPVNSDRLSELERNTILKNMGLMDPIPVQLFNFLKKLITKFDFGTSIRYRTHYPVIEIIKSKAPISFRFGMTAIFLSMPLGMALGVMMARKKGGLWDKVGTGYIVLMQAFPAAVYYVIIQLYGSLALNVPMLYSPDKPSSMFLPIFIMCLPNIAGYALWMRRYMVDEINKDYIKLAEAKGVPQTSIFFRHVFRNAVVPMTNAIPATILFTIVGSIYVESLFSIPGTGGLLVDVIKQQDNPMTQALVIIYSSLSVFGLLFGDILMALVDPRIRLHKKGDQR
jgi:oligopeptide transport system permease protein